MGFAAGFAAGYNAVDKAITRKEARDKAIADDIAKADKVIKDDMNSYMKISNEQFKIINEATAANADSSGISSEDFNKNIGKINAAKEYLAKQANNPNRTPAMAAYDKSLGLDLNPSEPQVLSSIDSYDGGKKDVYLPESMSSMADSYVYGEDKTIHQYAMDGDKYDKKVTNPTNYTPLNLKDDTTGDTSKFAKVTYKDGTVKEGVFTDEQLLTLSKDSSVSNVNKQYKPSEDSDGYTWKDLPKEAQDKALKEGKSLDEPVTNSVYNSYWGKDKTSKDGKITKASQQETFMQLKELERTGNLDESQKLKMNLLDTYLGTDADTKNATLLNSVDVLFNYTNGDKDIDDISKSDINKVYLMERQTNFKGLGETEKKLLRDSEGTISSGKRLVEKLSKIDNEEVDRGFFDAIGSFVKKNVSDNTWEDMSEANKATSLLSIGVDTSLGNALAQYIKSISGTAVAEAEYDRLRKVFTTGNYSNVQSLKKAVGTFYEDLQYSHKTRLKDNLLEGGSFVMNKLQTHTKRFGKSKNRDNAKVPEADKTTKDSSKAPTVVKTGRTKDGRIVTKYSDGRIVYGK